MPAATVNLSCKQGETFRAEFTFYQSDGTTPLNISGWAITADVKSTLTSGVVASFTTGIKAGTTNTLTLLLTAAQTGTIPCTGETFADTESFLTDVKANAGGDVEYLIAGPFTVTPRATA